MRLGTCWVSIYGDLEFSRILLGKEANILKLCHQRKGSKHVQKFGNIYNLMKTKDFLLTNACEDFSINEPTPNILLYLPKAKH